jgi:hypothetical protein
MFQRATAIIRELTRSLQATCWCALHKYNNDGISSEVGQLVILGYGCKWIGLTVAGGSGLLWNTAQGPDDGGGAPKHAGVSD